MTNWRDLFSTGDLMHMREATQRYPNAARLLADCAFISHAGADMPIIESDLVSPILFRRKGPNGYFLHNAKSGGAEAYKHTVLIALYFCRYAIVVVSKNSRSHSWVAAEVDWLLDHRRPIATYALDDTPPSMVHPSLGAQSTWPSEVKWFDRTHLDELVKWIDVIDPESAKAITPPP